MRASPCAHRPGSVPAARKSRSIWRAKAETISSISSRNRPSARADQVHARRRRRKKRLALAVDDARAGLGDQASLDLALKIALVVVGVVWAFQCLQALWLLSWSRALARPLAA